MQENLKAVDIKLEAAEWTLDPRHLQARINVGVGPRAIAQT